MSDTEEIEMRAAQWLARREASDWSAAEQAALDAWLDASMLHKAAYWRLEHGWRQVDRIAALGRADHAPPVREAPRSTPRRIDPWRWSKLAAAALAVLVAGQPANVPQTTERVAATRVGQHRTVVLADGSAVDMNTATRIRAVIGTERREVWLDRGEAFFDVRHDAGMPFIVHAGDRTITVLGTRFAVRRGEGGVTVSVLSGRVQVDSAPQGRGGAQSAILTPGVIARSQATATLFTATSIEHVGDTLAWRQGMLKFDDVPLSDAIAEFNRYHTRQIEIADPAARAIRIGGKFQASNVDAFLRLLHSAFGLKIAAENGTTIISS